MRKIGFIIICLALTMLALACTNSDNNGPTDDKSNISNSDNNGQTGDKAIIEGAVQAMSNLDSYSFNVEINMEQKMFERWLESTKQIESDILLKPLRIYHQQTETYTGTDEPFISSLYIADEGSYIYNPETEKWNEFPISMFDEITPDDIEHANPAQVLEQLVELADDFRMTEDDHIYRLELSSSSNNLKKALFTQIPKQGVGQFTNIRDMIDVDELEFVIEIEKDTLYKRSLHMIATYTVTYQEEKIPVHQEIKSNFHSFNDIESIIVPQKIVDEAVNILEEEGFSWDDLFNIEGIEPDREEEEQNHEHEQNQEQEEEQEEEEE